MVRSRSISDRPSRIDRPGHHDVELAPAGILEHRVKARALVAPLGAADAGVAVGRDHGPAPALCDLPELLELVVDGLVIGADADVERSALCCLRARGALPKSSLIVAQGGIRNQLLMYELGPREQRPDSTRFSEPDFRHVFVRGLAQPIEASPNDGSEQHAPQSLIHRCSSQRSTPQHPTLRRVAWPGTNSRTTIRRSGINWGYLSRGGRAPRRRAVDPEHSS